VSRVVCGYTGGQYESPTSSNKQDHSEALLIEFNPKQLTFNDLLVLWMQAHNPFEPQFRSALFPTSKEQREVIDKYLVMVQYLRPRDRVYVHIHTPTHFYRADDSFQKFSDKRSWPTQTHHRKGERRRGRSKGERRRDSSSSSLKAESKEDSSRSMVDDDSNKNLRVSLMKGDDGAVSVSEGTDDDDPPSVSVFGRWSKTLEQQPQQQPTDRHNNRRSSRNMRGCLTLLAATNIVSTSHSAAPPTSTTKGPRRVATTEATSRMNDGSAVGQ
jgi:peptide-methionine (S)-S-oxide reductase